MKFANVFVQKVYDRYLLYRYIFPFLRKNKNREITPENTICLFSFMRSGSTWLSELLLTIPKSCLFDEPFLRNLIESPNSKPDSNVRRIKEIADLDFYYYQPIPEDEEWPEAKVLFETLFKGQALSIGLYDDYGLQRLKKAETYVSKLNHNNLMSQWLIKNFHISSLFLLRNPYASLASILRHSKNILTVSEPSRIPDFKFNELFKKYEGVYNSIKTKEEYFTFLWCLNAKEGPMKLKESQGLVIFYEDLLLDFEKEINRIFRYLKQPVPKEVFENRFVPSFSAEAYAKKYIESNTQVNAWKSSLSNEQIRRIGRILKEFEIDFYDLDALPKHERFYSSLENN